MSTASFIRLFHPAVCVVVAIAFCPVWETGAASPDSKEPFPGARFASGMVFLDQNENGRRDTGERGLAGVRLLAGWEMAVTDERGRYSIEAGEPFHNVSICVPEASWLSAEPDAWFRRMESDRETHVDFGLLEEEQAYPFLFGQVTDDHGDHPRTFPIGLEECERLPLKPKFYVCTGDMRRGYPRAGNNNGRSYQYVAESFSKFTRPFFMVPGNHDTTSWCFNKSAELPTEEQRKHPRFLHGGWERYICPANWSFTYGGVHFMGACYNLCNTYPDGRRICTPGMDVIEGWIDRELKSCPATASRTVLLCHEPVMGADLLNKFHLTRALVGAHHQAGRNAGGGGLHPEKVRRYSARRE